MQTKGGQTTISSRACPSTRGRRARMNSRACCGVLYIFQLAAMSFLRAIRSSYRVIHHGDTEARGRNKVFRFSPWLRVSVVLRSVVLLVLVGEGLDAGQL